MKRVLMYEGETITTRPTRVTCRYRLSNGQLLSVYFSRQRTGGKHYDPDINYVWRVGVHIGSSKRRGNRWYNGKGRKVKGQTGRCGMEGLAVAARYIIAFGKHKCGMRDEMQIGWTDEKRMRAYRYLLRYPGFAWYAGDNGKGQCVAYRNPEIYEWIPKKDPVAISYAGRDEVNV